MTRRELEEERSFLLRSLEDLDREHQAGDLSDDDHTALRDRYVARAATVLRTLEGDMPPDPSAHAEEDRRRRRRGSVAGRVARRLGGSSRRGRLLVGLGVVGLLVVMVVVVADHTGVRLPGESATGSVTLTGAQQTTRTLAQAEVLEQEGNAVGALELYQSVLRSHPSQEEALAESGWLEYEAGAQAKDATLLSLGQRQEEKAAGVDPGAYAPRLYLGSMLLTRGDDTGAVAQYRLFLADHPPTATVASAASFITEAFSGAGEPVPALPAGASAPG